MFIGRMTMMETPTETDEAVPVWTAVGRHSLPADVGG